MTIREKIGKSSAWKVVAMILLGIFFVLAGIEKLFISRIIKIFDHRITQFEKIFKDDDQDLEEDTKRFNEQQEYDTADYKLSSFKIRKDHLATHQNKYCDDLIINRELNKILKMSYVKHHPSSRKAILDEIEMNQKIMDEAKVQGQFDPAVCKEVVL